MNYFSNRLFDGGSAQSLIPARLVCWSRMQAEAGQTLDAIIIRKELERQAGNGLFLWGVGNAPSRLTRVLARAAEPVRAVFSVMKSRPRAVDTTPAAVLLWRAYVDGDGAMHALPETSLVTSRADTGNGRKRAHYALMCHSDEPLAITRGARRFDPAAFRNVGENGGPVGASQVTALLQQVDEECTDGAYEVNMAADLVAGYWVRLADPLLVGVEQLRDLDRADDMSVEQWRRFAVSLRGGGARPHNLLL
jgi:hypothetical protein